MHLFGAIIWEAMPLHRLDLEPPPVIIYPARFKRMVVAAGVLHWLMMDITLTQAAGLTGWVPSRCKLH